MNPTRWPLFTRYPTLGQQLAPLELCTLPTPVEAMPALSTRAWIKRDDQTHPEYGGNKLRKLELVGAEMQRTGARRAVIFGATGTNAGVAAAMVCRQLGIALTVLTFDQPASSTVTKNAALMKHYGARVEHVGSLLATVLRWYAHPWRLDRRTYFLFAGCSNPVATFAYANAAFELKAQVESGACPMPAEIVVAAGSVATLAGLTLGCALAGLPARVIGVRVSPSHVGPFAANTTAVVGGMMRAARKTLEAAEGVAVPELPEPILEDRWYGGGYGVATPEGALAIARFAASGIVLEQTYTAKAAAAFVERLDANIGDVLFWNTLNARPDPPGLGAPSGAPRWMQH